MSLHDELMWEVYGIAQRSGLSATRSQNQESRSLGSDEGARLVSPLRASGVLWRFQ